MASLSKLKALGSQGLLSLEEFIIERIGILSSKLESATDIEEMKRVQGELRALRWILSSAAEAKK